MTSPIKIYCVSTILSETGVLTLDQLPFQAGQSVEVIIVPQLKVDPANRYPLRGLPVVFDRPTEPVAAEDWDAAS